MNVEGAIQLRKGEFARARCTTTDPVLTEGKLYELIEKPIGYYWNKGSAVHSRDPRSGPLLNVDYTVLDDTGTSEEISYAWFEVVDIVKK